MCINDCDLYGETALHIAVRSCNAAHVKCLLDANASIEAKNQTGSTPLLLSMQPDSTLRGPLQFHRNSHPQLMEEKENNARTIEAIVKLLLDANTDLSARNDLGMTALHLAVRFNAPNLIRLMFNANEARAGAQIEGVATTKKHELETEEGSGNKRLRRLVCSD